MAKIIVELVKYDMDKTKKRKRSNLLVEARNEKAVIEKLEKIHKGEKVESIQEIVWATESSDVATEEVVKKLTGRVKFFDTAKGFGFIQPDVDMDDLFFHISSLDGVDIFDEDLVEFELTSGPKGDIAIHVKLID